MEEINKKIGDRLREVRTKYINGYKLSISQFAELFSETHDKITNYENGRSQISINLLIELYYYGINPIYILTGEESVYAKNTQGNDLRNKIEGSPKINDEILNTKNNVIIIANADLTKLSIDELLRESGNIKVAANPDVVINKIKKKKE